ncbi:hypothetical protein COLU111180_11985 [Cohnella lubricantis]|uniref:Gene transfer agent family protein n=1 Tax=Cohnella lubricantis TaxID=2163172 RepID=A0A841T791_9BACL|nr:hypothetical protein [Cohnella lubricantis]MBB6675979.1 hypothetical protein [Cohnella lubricantis]MBP2117902.1 hypothetical protein [Cohnella lubricantis]
MSERSFVEVELGGKSRLLKYDFNAVCEVEERTGKGVAAIFSENSVGFNTVRLFLWAGLKWKIPGIQPAQVGQWLQQEVENGKTPMTFLQPIMVALKRAKILREVSVDELEKNAESSLETEADDSHGEI